MDVYLTGLFLLGFVLLCLGFGVWIFAGIALAGMSALYFILDFPPDRIGALARTSMLRSVSGWELSAIPLFIWMGEIMFRSDLSARLFRGLAPLSGWIPGGLIHTNVAGCTLFGAVSGSSAATTATVGQITIKELRDRKYDFDLSAGSLAAAGSLGLLIPPSIVLIVYGVVAEVSISRLFLAGIVPGLFIALSQSGYVALRCLFTPSLAPKTDIEHALPAVLTGLHALWPIVVMIVVVMGAIYSGLATPTEAAAVGVLVTICIVGLTGQFSLVLLKASALAAVRSSCMIISIMISAALLSTTVGYLHIPTELASAVARIGLSPVELIVAIGLLYLILGCFLDGVSITVMTIPIVLPMVMVAGFDPIWFGIFLVVMVEIGQITPPVGFNLFVMQGITGQPLSRIAWAAAPFVLIMLACLAVMTAIPSIVTWLPSVLLS